MPELDCAFLHADARVHAVGRSGNAVTPLCGVAAVHVRVDAPFEADDDLACAHCAEAALRLPAAG